jgi:hypothetical protein
MRGCILAILAFAVPSSASAQTAIPYTVVFDSYMTPAAGAQDLVTLQHLTASAEDRWLPARLGTKEAGRRWRWASFIDRENFSRSTCRRSHADGRGS